MKTTIEYFGLDADALLQENEVGYTKEENLLFDSGSEIVFFDHEEMESEKEEFAEYVKSREYEIKETLITINGRIAVILV